MSRGYQLSGLALCNKALLRHPLERALSLIYYLSSSQDNSGEDNNVISAAKNFLSSEGSICESCLVAAISDVYVEHFSKIYDEHSSTHDRFERAIAAIKKYAIIGIYNEMPEFIGNVSKLVGVNQAPELRVINKTINKPSIDNVPQRIIQKLENLTALDTKFYLRVLNFYKNINNKTLGGVKSITTSIVKVDKPEPYANIPEEVIFQLVEPSPLFYIERHKNFHISFILQIPIELNGAKICFHILDINNKCLLASNTSDLGVDASFEPGNSLKICFSMKADFPLGRYFLGIVVLNKIGDRYFEYMWIDSVCEINVVRNYNLVEIGSCQTPVTVKLIQTKL